MLEAPHDLDARTGLLRGAAHAGAALGVSFMGLAHAIAQALGGRYGLPHGAMNALVLAPTLRFNEPVAGDALARLGEALGEDPAAAASASHGWPGSSACATSTCPKRSSPRWPQLPSYGPPRGRIRAAATAEEVTELLRTRLLKECGYPYCPAERARATMSP